MSKYNAKTDMNSTINKIDMYMKDPFLFHLKEITKNEEVFIKKIFNNDSPYFDFKSNFKEKIYSQLKEVLGFEVSVNFKELNSLSFTLNSSIDFNVEVKFNKENFVEVSNQDIGSIENRIEEIEEQINLLNISIELLKKSKKNIMAKLDYKEFCYYTLYEAEKILMTYIEESKDKNQIHYIVKLLASFKTIRKNIYKLRLFPRKRIKTMMLDCEKEIANIKSNDKIYLEKLKTIKNHDYNKKKKLLAYIKEEYRKKDFIPISTNIEIKR